MDTHYDIIVIGGGPNGLEAGAYLSKAGQKVLVLEYRYECGGGLWTEESTLPGYLHSTLTPRAIRHATPPFGVVLNNGTLTAVMLQPRL